MRNYITPILTIAIVASLAGVLYIRANVDGSRSSSAEPAAVASPGPAVEYFVRSSDGKAALYAYLLSSGKTENWSGDGIALGPIRFNQSANVCDAVAGSTALAVTCDSVDGNLRLRAVDGDALDAKTVLDTTIDLRALGLNPSAEEGYLVPVAVSDDKSIIYLGRRVETESWVAGLWKIDVATGEVSEISFVRAKNLYQYDINPVTQQLVGVTFSPPESLDALPAGPAATYLVDLKTGDGRILTPADASVSENPILSDDATTYATKWIASDKTFVNSLNPLTTVAAIDGVAKDWFGDTMVFDRDGNLFLYDLKTNTETQLTHETDATVEYLGVVK